VQDCITKLYHPGRNVQADGAFQPGLERWRSASPLPQARKDQPEFKSSGSRRVLIVEDNCDGRETLRTLLQLLGHRVEVAEDGPAGLDKAVTWQPEVVLLDIGLPRLDGYQVARQLRRRFGDRILLIAHTGYGQPEDRRRAFEAGFNAHLVKPVDLRELCCLLTYLPARVPA
jgi:CheY-like chemotaxis protein